MKANIVFDIFFLYLTFPQLSACAHVPTHIFVTRAGPCYDVVGSPVRISEMRVARVNYDVTVSGQLNVTINISDGWTVKATMQKCADIRNIDTCDHFKSFSVIEGGCAGRMGEEVDLSRIFFRYTRPRMSCPILAGVYTVVDYPYYSEDNYLLVAESKISTSMFGYTLRLEGFHKQKRIMCVDVYLRLLYIRKNQRFGDANVPETPTAAGEDGAADVSNVADDSGDEDEQ